MLPESRVKEPYADIQDGPEFIPQGLYQHAMHGFKFRGSDGVWRYKTTQNPLYQRALLSGQVEIRRRKELTRLGHKPYVPASTRQLPRIEAAAKQLQGELELQRTRRAYVAYYAKFGIKVQEIPVVAK